MLLMRLRKGSIDDEDFRFITRTMQSLIYKNQTHMAQAIKLTPRSLRRIFNGDQPPHRRRIQIFESYLRAVDRALTDLDRAPRQKPKPRR